MVPPSVVVVSHFLVLSRKPIGTALEISCLKAGTDITGLVLILMISDQCTYTCLHHNIPFYASISHILTFARFPDFCDWRVASLHVNFQIFFIPSNNMLKLSGFLVPNKININF